MKKKITNLIIAIVLSAGLYAQAPEGVNYQTVVRDATGNILANTYVSFILNIRQTTATGTIIFSETHNDTTNSYGLSNLVLGNGILIAGTFSTINWGNDVYFLEVEFDPTGGTSFNTMGTSQLLSVPYALYAKSSGSSPSNLNGTTDYLTKFTSPTTVGDALIYDNGTNVSIGSSTPTGLFHMNQSTSKGFDISRTSFTETMEIRLSDNINSQEGLLIEAISNNRLFWIGADGNVGIGLTDPTGKFHMNQSTSKGFDISRSSFTETMEIRLSDNINSQEGLLIEAISNNRLFWIGADGNVGIGLTDPTATLTVDGNANKPGGGSWAVFSDKRLKKDIKSFESGLSSVLQIQPKTFKYNGKGGISNTEKEYVGIIAQDMQKIAPYMIREVEFTEEESKSKETYLEFDPSALDFMIINAIKELNEKIEQLKKENTDLKLRYKKN